MTTTPLAIVIFEKDGATVYKAYSPMSIDGDLATADTFMDKVYAHLGYSLAKPMETMTEYGAITEIHLRSPSVPLTERGGGQVYFTTFHSPGLKYWPVHRASPVFFQEEDMGIYYAKEMEMGRAPGGLAHNSCSHEFI